MRLCDANIFGEKKRREKEGNQIEIRGIVANGKDVGKGSMRVVGKALSEIPLWPSFSF